MFVSVRGGDPAEITRCHEAMSDGATIRAALGPAPWGSPLHAMLDDRFGITWVVDVSATH